jgi:hypothetical protein
MLVRFGYGLDGTWLIKVNGMPIRLEYGSDGMPFRLENTHDIARWNRWVPQGLNQMECSMGPDTNGRSEQ